MNEIIQEVHKKLEKYRNINPLEYISMIKTIELSKRGLYIVFNDSHLNILGNPDTIENTCISFNTKMANTYYSTKDDFKFFSRIDTNNFKILDDPVHSGISDFQYNIYTMYSQLKRATEVIDFLVKLDILSINHNTKSIYVVKEKEV